MKRVHQRCCRYQFTALALELFEKHTRLIMEWVHGLGVDLYRKPLLPASLFGSNDEKHH
jgi:hypothetical protein